MVEDVQELLLHLALVLGTPQLRRSRSSEIFDFCPELFVIRFNFNVVFFVLDDLSFEILNGVFESTLLVMGVLQSIFEFLNLLPEELDDLLQLLALGVPISFLDCFHLSEVQSWHRCPVGLLPSTIIAVLVIASNRRYSHSWQRMTFRK